MNMRSFLITCFLACSLGVWAQSNKQKYVAALVTNNMALQKEIAAKNVNTYSNFSYTYYKLLLESLPKNAVLITNSIDDTFPISILQLTKNIRTDVKIISLALLADSIYLKQINDQHKTQLVKGKESTMIAQLKVKVKRLYISTTVKSKLWFNTSNYLVGLTVQSSNTSQYKKLGDFYTSYKKLKLKSYSYTNSDLSIIRNILPPLITLYKIDSSIPYLKSHILELAHMVHKAEQVKKMIETD